MTPDEKQALGYAIAILRDRLDVEAPYNAAIIRGYINTLAALRSRPAPPDDLALRHAWEAGFRLCRSYGDNHHHFDGEQKERRWLDYIKGLAAPAPVAAPAPEERSPYDSGLCCMARHASAKPPWSCDCPCHTAPAPETRVSYSCPHCGREYDRPVPAPETPAPDAMPEIQAGDVVKASNYARPVEMEHQHTVDWFNERPFLVESVQRVIWRRQEAQP